MASSKHSARAKRRHPPTKIKSAVEKMSRAQIKADHDKRTLGIFFGLVFVVGAVAGMFVNIAAFAMSKRSKT